MDGIPTIKNEGGLWHCSTHIISYNYYRPYKVTMIIPPVIPGHFYGPKSLLFAMRISWRHCCAPTVRRENAAARCSSAARPSSPPSQGSGAMGDAGAMVLD